MARIAHEAFRRISEEMHTEHHFVPTGPWPLALMLIIVVFTITAGAGFLIR